MDKVQAVHDYYEDLNKKIQYTICTTEDDMDAHIPSLDITSLIAISYIRANSHFCNLYLPPPPEWFTTELVYININAIQSKAITT